VLEVIRELGLELHVILNKGAVMVLPAGVNKATGLAAALDGMGVSPHNVVGVGDAENDHAFLELCACSAAVANALPALKERADLVTSRTHGAGVVELIDKLIANDLSEVEPHLEQGTSCELSEPV
jgi:hydroxymethylpyrimidine pyrophosphatase-like HAD family hydrolase